MPGYAASKAAVHAHSEALRAQLDNTGVGVVELVPRPSPGQDRVVSHALPLDDFATEVVHLPSHAPHEVLAKGVLMPCWVGRDGTYDDLVAQRFQALAMLPGRQGNTIGVRLGPVSPGWSPGGLGGGGTRDARRTTLCPGLSPASRRRPPSPVSW